MKCPIRGCDNETTEWLFSPYRAMFGQRKPCPSCVARLDAASRMHTREMVCPDACALSEGHCPLGRWKRTNTKGVSARVQDEPCKARQRGEVLLLTGRQPPVSITITFTREE